MLKSKLFEKEISLKLAEKLEVQNAQLNKTVEHLVSENNKLHKMISDQNQDLENGSNYDLTVQSQKDEIELLREKVKQQEELDAPKI